LTDASANAGFCEITSCKPNYKHDENTNQCLCDTAKGFEVDKSKACVPIGGACAKAVLNVANAKTGRRVFDVSTNKETCNITACQDGFGPNPVDGVCLKIEGECDAAAPLPPNAAKGAKSYKDGKTVCTPTECTAGYEPAGLQCVAIAGNCKNLPAHAQSGERKYDETAKTETCLVTACMPGYNLVDGACQPELSEADSAAKVNELRDNAQAMKDKERSLENRLLGAAAIGATGIGGMQLASGLAEQSADKAAEQDMAA
jgi:hypothetical protein